MRDRKPKKSWFVERVSKSSMYTSNWSFLIYFRWHDSFKPISVFQHWSKWWWIRKINNLAISLYLCDQIQLSFQTSSLLPTSFEWLSLSHRSKQKQLKFFEKKIEFESTPNPHWIQLLCPISTISGMETGQRLVSQVSKCTKSTKRLKSSLNFWIWLVICTRRDLRIKFY